MRRRVFLSGAATAGGAAALGLSRARLAYARASAPVDLLTRARVSAVARFVSFGAAAAPGVVDVPLGLGATARRNVGVGVGAGAWSCTLRALPVTDPGSKTARPDTVDLVATFKLDRGSAPETSVGLGLSFSRWSTGHYVVMPGAVYAGNRFESRHIAYPPLLAEDADIGPHVPPIVSDIPRLNVRAGPSRLELLATDLATPAVAVHAPDTRTGLVALFDPTTRLGPSGVVLEETDDRGRATLVLLAPGGAAREDVARATASPRASVEAQGATFRARDELVLRVRLVVFDCADVPALFERLARARKDLTGPTARPHELPFSAAFAAHEARANRSFVEDAGYFAVPARDPARRLWQSGWGGGFATTLPLAAAGNARSRARAQRAVAFAFRVGQARSGFFHSLWDGRQGLEDGPAAPAAVETARRAPRKRAGKWHLVRRSADALMFALEHVRVLAQLDPSFRPDAAVLRGIERCADAFVRLWDREKQFGQYVDVDTGAIVVGGSAAGGLAPAGLALAGVVLKRDDYLAVARAAAEEMYERHVRAGVTCGAPGDALQCPDGESAAALLESFVTLFEQAGEPVWLERATAAAAQLASWVISYDAPAGAAADGAARATGAMFVNAQNVRGAPGYTLLSGAALLRLYRATGEVRHLELLRDTVHNLAQYLPRAERAERAGFDRLPAQRRGRADTSAWLDDDDDLLPARAVFDASAMLSYTEVPGVYVRTDTAFVFAFDHVDARVRARERGSLVVTLENPTSIDAAVRVLAESDLDAARPLAPGAVLAARVVAVPAGGAVDVTFDVPPPPAP